METEYDGIEEYEMFYLIQSKEPGFVSAAGKDRMRAADVIAHLSYPQLVAGSR